MKIISLDYRYCQISSKAKPQRPKDEELLFFTKSSQMQTSVEAEKWKRNFPTANLKTPIAENTGFKVTFVIYHKAVWVMAGFT